MNKDILKHKLAILTENSKFLTPIVDLLNEGPKRNLSFSGGKFILEHDLRKCKFYWNMKDPNTAISCLVATGRYEEIETTILTFLVRQSRTTLDIGANVGYYSVLLGLSLQDDAGLIAFEPFPQSYKALQNNLNLNQLEDKVNTVQIALSDKAGIAELYVPELSGSSAASLNSLHPTENETKVRIRTTTLDAIVSEYQLANIDLIKIDVEGAEWLVLQGGWKTIKLYRPVIFAELLRKWSAKFSYHPNTILANLSELDYSCFAVGKNLRKITEISEDTNETNFLFLTNSENHKKFEKDLLNILEDA